MAIPYNIFMFGNLPDSPIDRNKQPEAICNARLYPDNGIKLSASLTKANSFELLLQQCNDFWAGSSY